MLLSIHSSSDASGHVHPSKSSEYRRARAQMRTSFYRMYAARLASWGFVAVQYDDPLLKIIDDATEVLLMLCLL